MSIKSIARAAAGKVSRQMLKGQKHAPVIMFSAGVVGVVATVVLASRATLKLEEVVEEVEEKLEISNSLAGRDDYSEADARHDKIVIYTRATIKIAKLYGPAFLVGAASVGLLTGSHVVLTRRNTGLIAAYAALDRGFKEYRNRVEKSIGHEKEREIFWDLVGDEVPAENGGMKQMSTAEGTRTGYKFLFDQVTSSSWENAPGHNQFFVACQQNYANDKLRWQGHLFLNEVLDMLGLQRVPEGQQVGWLYNTCEGEGGGFVDFGIFAEDSKDSGTRWVMGQTQGVWLHFNVDGTIWDKI